ncbi:TRAP transporter large permease [Paenalcaligenes hominis]|uniref:TRAP transporter large permease n=1 Tax=Paenalcaligenes hominis TaxID=643674 RepID=UPI003524B162
MIAIGISILVILAVFFIFGAHVAVALAMTALITGLIYIGSIWDFFAHIPWNVVSGSTLIVVPLFVLMGELLVRSGVTDDLYAILARIMRPVPGGLLHTNILACGLFSSISGSSVATATTIGSAAMPVMRKYRYSERLAVGSLASGGTLGVLIPPSVILIIYGLLAEVSIGELYIAGVIPGLAMMIAFMVVILALAFVFPKSAPKIDKDAIQKISWVKGALNILPILILFLVVIGSIYLGVATATESAAFGATGALLIAACKRKVNKNMLCDVFVNTATTTAMVLFILIGAFLLQFILSMSGIPSSLSKWVISLGLSKTELIILICLIYLVLGMFLESLAMLVMTIPIIVPILQAMQIDLVWFGIIATIMVEVSLITPPVGMNLFVIQSMRNRLDQNMPQKSMMDLYIGAFPFALTMLIVLTTIIIWPSIATGLVSYMR